MTWLLTARQALRAITWKGWLAIGLLAAFVAFGAYCSNRAAETERARQAAEQAEAERRASSARETAAGERLNDTITIRDRQQERDDAAEALPDSPPDDREFRRRCRQLRDAGVIVPECG